MIAVQIFMVPRRFIIKLLFLSFITLVLTKYLQSYRSVPISLSFCQLLIRKY